MKLSFVAFAFAATAITAPALAAPVSGARIEGVVGYDNVRVDFGPDDESQDGVLYGVGIGYDFAVTPTTSVGIDAEAADATTDIEFVDGADSAKISAGRDLYVGGRVTTAVSDRVNLYGKLGYTNARIKATVTEGGVTTSESANGDGIRAGMGAQYALGTNSYVGTEYRYSNYEAGLSRHQVAATFGFRF